MPPLGNKISGKRKSGENEIIKNWESKALQDEQRTRYKNVNNPASELTETMGIMKW